MKLKSFRGEIFKSRELKRKVHFLHHIFLLSYIVTEKDNRIFHIPHFFLPNDDDVDVDDDDDEWSSFIEENNSYYFLHDR